MGDVFIATVVSFSPPLIPLENKVFFYVTIYRNMLLARGEHRHIRILVSWRNTTSEARTASSLLENDLSRLEQSVT